MRTCLVTGGAGFIGSHLVAALVQRGDRVRVLDNLSTGHASNLEAAGHERIELTEGDVADAGVVAEVMDGVDYVFHLAAQVSVPRSVEDPLATNAACATGTLTVLEAARKAGVRRLVFAGSSAAYGDRPTAAKRETDPPDPLSPYAAAKLAGEHYCHAYAATMGLETVCLRFFNVFGPRQDPASEYSAVIPLFLTKLLAGERPTVFGDGTQSRDFTFVENVVHGNLLAAEAPGASGRTLNIADGRSTTLLALLSMLNELLGTDVEPVFAPPRVGDVRESMADISQARTVLGYEPQVSFEDGLRHSVEYYRQTVTATTR
ncbi:MAG: SDR family oxidoreductase [Planctomycetes bacterium]|nr:SDR family oxidoreductase [Planctomycetota bacterium]